MLNVGFAELILILLVAFLFVGPKDLPKVARALARAVRYFQELFKEFKDEIGLDETLTELKKAEDDIKKTLGEADPTHEIRKVQQETQKVIRGAKKVITKKPGSGI